MAALGPIDRLQRRLLNLERRWDYLYVIILACVPIVYSYAIGAHWSFPGDCAENAPSCLQFTGYWHSPSWMFLVVMLPVGLFLLRWMTDVLFGIGKRRYSDRPVALLSLLDDRGRSVSGERLTSVALDGRNLLLVFVLAILFHVVDMWWVIETYVTDDTSAQGFIHSWGHIYLWAESCPKFFDTALCDSAPGVDKLVNLVLVITAYLAQIVIFTIGTMAVVLFYRHNVFYLRLIYQRSRASKEDEGGHIVLDLDDNARSFGLRKLHMTFNLQIVTLVVAGIFVLVSRYAHITSETSREIQKLLDKLDDQIDDLSVLGIAELGVDTGALFPTWGQVLMSLIWIAGFAVVLLPSMAKYKPFFSRQVLRDGMSIVSYLREFIPPELENSKYPLNSDDDVSAVAAKFARNSFWPAGDEFAKIVFYFVFFVLIVVIIPVGLGEHMSFWYLLLTLVIAVLLSHLMIRVLRFTLALVDRRLVT